MTYLLTELLIAEIRRRFVRDPARKVPEHFAPRRAVVQRASSLRNALIHVEENTVEYRHEPRHEAVFSVLCTVGLRKVIHHALAFQKQLDFINADRVLVEYDDIYPYPDIPPAQVGETVRAVCEQRRKQTVQQIQAFPGGNRIVAQEAVKLECPAAGAHYRGISCIGAHARHRVLAVISGYLKAPPKEPVLGGIL